MEEVEYSVYFVPVPIGNRADITLRALDVLRKVDVIACEDTRHSGLLLSHYEIRKPLISMHDHNEQPRAGEIAARAAGGESFAVISDAGMPGVSGLPSHSDAQGKGNKLHRPSRTIRRGDGSGGVRIAYGRLLLRRLSARQIREKKRRAPNGGGSVPYQYFL